MDVLCYGNNKPTCNVENCALREKVIHLAKWRKNDKANGPITLDDEIYIQYTFKFQMYTCMYIERKMFGIYVIIIA